MSRGAVIMFLAPVYGPAFWGVLDHLMLGGVQFCTFFLGGVQIRIFQVSSMSIIGSKDLLFQTEPPIYVFFAMDLLAVAADVHGPALGCEE